MLRKKATNAAQSCIRPDKIRPTRALSQPAAAPRRTTSEAAPPITTTRACVAEFCDIATPPRHNAHALSWLRVSQNGTGVSQNVATTKIRAESRGLTQYQQRSG